MFQIIFLATVRGKQAFLCTAAQLCKTGRILVNYLVYFLKNILAERRELTVSQRRGLPHIFDVLFWVNIKKVRIIVRINVDCEYLAN